MEKLINHYNALIDENNDPVHDPLSLKEYMDKWDGQIFIDSLQLSSDKNVLEIGVGTGRLAVKVCGECNNFYGIDISPKTIERAKENLREFKNINLICNDYMTYSFNKTFDVIYSSLTFMHIKDKRTAIQKVADLLNTNGRFVLSISKEQQTIIDYGNRKLNVYPDTSEEIKAIFNETDLIIEDFFETDFAFIFVGVRCAK